MIKYLKIFALCLLVVVLTIAALVAYDQYAVFEREQELLSYSTTNTWGWHDKYNRIQIRYSPEMGRSILRKVDMSGGYVVYARKNDDYSLSAMAEFLVDCEAGKEIITSQEYADGELKKLVCSEGGDSLRYSVSWSAEDTKFTWEENLDGFRLKENFSDWNFDKLDQEVTLGKGR